MRRVALVLLAGCSGARDGGITPIALDVTPTTLIATVVVNGSAPIPVLVDTGSVGLRVFAADLAAVTVDTTSESVTADVGSHVLVGRLASGTVRLGDVELPGALAFQLVDSGDTASFTAAGAHGVLGLGLRAGSPAAIYNPLAQLTGFTSYAIHTGGFDSTAGSIELAASSRGYTTQDLAPAGTLPDGLPAWADDAIATCYSVGGSPIDPPCTPTAIDSSAGVDVLAVTSLPAGDLPDGTAFAFTIGAFAADFTAGTTPGRDLVHVAPAPAHATLGIEVFFRESVVYDLATGAIGFSAP